MNLRLIRGDSLSAATAQTGGMIRSAAISGDLTGASALWMGRTVAPRGEPLPDTEAVVVIARSTQVAIVVNVPSL